MPAFRRPTAAQRVTELCRGERGDRSIRKGWGRQCESCIRCHLEVRFVFSILSGYGEQKQPGAKAHSIVGFHFHRVQDWKNLSIWWKSEQWWPWRVVTGWTGTKGNLLARLYLDLWHGYVGFPKYSDLYAL